MSKKLRAIQVTGETAAEDVRNALTVLRIAEFEARQHRAARVALDFEDIAAVCRRLDTAVAKLDAERARQFDEMLRCEAATSENER